ncbi:MAG: hypothetical protein HOP28_12880 [Gemmatimonadales bacterium]|nr:hypothetical protein [Gemmatimonadales bacterium]
MEPFKVLLFSLAIATCLACTLLLFREYRRRRLRLLLWSALCFVGLTVNNVLLFLDVVVLPDGDLRLPRLVASLGGMLFLLYGFVWEAES